jgi:ATP-dependent RNA helicase DDX10/DBP4
MKGIVFVNTCKEVRYYYEVFKRLRIGNYVEQLHGRMQQYKRTSVFYDYTSKSSAVLFATDIAARGLDFPNIDWVIQLNCPDDVDTYIHRVGRTARYKNNGKALLMLASSEVKFIEKLTERKIIVKKVSINPDKIVSVTPKVESFLAEDPDLKYLGQKAFITYMRSVFLQKDKEVFKVDEIDAVKLSQSMGLPGAPKIKMIQDAKTKQLKNMNREMKKLLHLDESKSDDQPKDKVTKLLNRKNRNLYDSSRENLRDDEADDSESDDELLKPSSKKLASDSEEEVSHESDMLASSNEEDELSDGEESYSEPESNDKESKQNVGVKRKWSKYLASEEEVGSANKELLIRYTSAMKEKVKHADPMDKQREQDRVRALHKLQKELARSEANQHLQSIIEEESEGEIIDGSSDDE